MKGIENVIKYRDKLLLLLAFLVLAAAIFLPAKPRVFPKVTSVVFTHWWNEDLGEEILADLIKEFEELHDGIKIVLSSISYEDMLHGFFDSPENPKGDVYALDPLWVPELQKLGIAEDFSSPFTSFLDVFYYNIDILKEAGFSRPPKTRSEFLNYSRAVSKIEKKYSALVVDKEDPRWIYDNVYPWIWSSGTMLMDDGRPEVNSRQVIDSFSFLAALNSEGLIVFGNKLENFYSGNAAFMISSGKDLNLVREHLGDDSFSISSVPAPDNYAGKFYYGIAAWTIGISSASPHKEEARLFADFLVKNASIFSKKTGALEAMPDMDALHLKMWDIAITGEPAREFYDLPWMIEKEKIFQEEIMLLFSQEITAVEAAESIQAKWEALY